MLTNQQMMHFMSGNVDQNFLSFSSRIPTRARASFRVIARECSMGPPTGHTRLPRYTRGKLGTIDRDHGVFVFPDTNARFLGEKPQHVYSVRFAASELWGDQAAPRNAVRVDMWDDYLEP